MQLQAYFAIGFTFHHCPITSYMCHMEFVQLQPALIDTPCICQFLIIPLDHYDFVNMSSWNVEAGLIGQLCPLASPRQYKSWLCQFPSPKLKLAQKLTSSESPCHCSILLLNSCSTAEGFNTSSGWGAAYQVIVFHSKLEKHLGGYHKLPHKVTKGKVLGHRTNQIYMWLNFLPLLVDPGTELYSGYGLGLEPIKVAMTKLQKKTPLLLCFT